MTLREPVTPEISLVAEHWLPPESGDRLTEADRSTSAQARAVPDLDRMLGEPHRRDPGVTGPLVDLGCGIGAHDGICRPAPRHRRPHRCGL